MADIQILPTEFRSGDEIIRGDFVIPKTDGPFPGICKFHGFPGRDNQVHGIASSLAGAGFVVLTFDFREFRHSSGLFSLTGEIEDAKATINHLLESNFVIVSWVGVYGASYSGTIAVCTAARDNRIDAVCLRAPVYDTLWFAKLPMLD
ncbi:MAG: alpha/beta hydrolase family protein, partial [Candidatus Thorarchaeota archaeon]